MKYSLVALQSQTAFCILHNAEIAIGWKWDSNWEIEMNNNWETTFGWRSKLATFRDQIWMEINMGDSIWIEIKMSNNWETTIDGDQNGQKPGDNVWMEINMDNSRETTIRWRSKWARTV